MAPLKFSSVLQTALDGQTTQAGWATTLRTMLGATPRIKCYRDASATATSPATTGTLFLDTGTTGGITISGYRISGIGTLTNTITRSAVDLSSGTSVLRIEGNGHWVECTLGLQGAANETTTHFQFTANPTATSGFASKISLLPPSNITSGTGYPAPDIDGDTPSYVIVEVGPDLNNLTIQGYIHFNAPIKNWVFEDKEIASNMGDIRVMQSSDSVIYGDMEIGAMLLSANAQVGTTGKPMHRVLCNYKPLSTNWLNYPTAGGYQQGNRTINGVSGTYGLSNTFPGPHRFRIMSADNRQLGVIDMDRDHSLINGSTLSEVISKTKPIRPMVNCAQMVVWESGPAKMNTYAKKWLAGVDTSLFLRESQMKRNDAVNPINLFVNSKDQINGLNHWFAAPKWGLPADKAQIDADIATRQANDPNLWGAYGKGVNTPTWAGFYGITSTDAASGLTYGAETVFGWGYEPASVSGHDMYSGPGGVRIDRAAVPTPIMINITNPNWTHLRDGTPISEMVTHWRKAYFNHAIHHFTNVKTFASVPVSEVLAGQWSHYKIYYNTSVMPSAGPDKSIPLFVYHPDSEYTTNLHNGAFVDINGRMPWNGFSVDWFHNYSAHGLAAAVYNDPALAVSAKFRYLASIMAQYNYNTPALIANAHYGMRSLAWIWQQHAFMWKLASDHPLGISRRDIEARIEAELMGIYNEIYVPLMVKNDPSMRFRSLRNLGLKVEIGGDNGKTWIPSSFSLHYYMAHVLQLWKQFGLWDVMWNRSDAIRAVLTMQVKHLDKGCIDYYLDTNGAYSGSLYGNDPNLWVGDRTTGLDSVEIAANWSDWQARVAPRNSNLEDLIHNADGTLRQTRDIGEWSKMQWPFIHRDYFPEIPCDRDLTACCALVNSWQQILANNISTLKSGGMSAFGLASNESIVHPGLGRPLPPPYLGVV